jgi:hypothetical protein
MNTVKPILLTPRIEEILRAIAFHRLMTARDLCHLLYSPSSLTHVREILASLSNAKYLYRFQLPHTSRGNTENVFVLGTRGREFLSSLGTQVAGYFRPYKVTHASRSQIMHDLVLTRFCVAAHVWCAKQPDFKLLETRTGYELARLPAAKVTPDAWLLFEKLKDGAHDYYSPVLLEVDRGSEHGQKFKHHLRARLEFIKKGGAYSKLFGQEAVTVAYVTTGEMPKYRQVRRRAMCTWASEVLKELGKLSWSPLFRFTAVLLDDLYSSPIFDEPVWYTPDSPVPISLLS